MTLASGNISLVSVNQSNAASGNAGSIKPRLSPDGRFVVFISDANDLVPNDNNGRRDVFLRDHISGMTTLVSVNTTGTASANGNSFDAYVSANGRYVVFASEASNLVPNDQNGWPDLFLRDLVTQTTKLVSINYLGTGSGNGLTFNTTDLAVTPDGRFVLFFSAANDLVTNDANNAVDLFVRDMVEGKTSLVSVNTAGKASGLGFVYSPSITADGRFITFQSDANDLVANDLRRGEGIDVDVFMRDMVTGVTSLISVNRMGTASANGPSRFASSTPDGRFVVFESSASDLVTNDNNVWRDVYVRDRIAGITTLVSVNKNGTTSTNPSNVIGAPEISADGRLVVFASIADDLAGNDTNRRVDIFARDLAAGTTTMVSRNHNGANGGNDDSENPVISSDGRFVIFQSLASDLTGTSDANGVTDIFAYNLKTGLMRLVSVNSAGTASGNNPSLEIGVSADGRSVVFSSYASDLVTNDANNSPDIFIHQSERMRFDNNDYSINEGDKNTSQGFASLKMQVKRTGDMSEPATVQYVTTDLSAGNECDKVTGQASQRCDYAAIGGTLRFAAGEETKTISIPIINDGYKEGNESFTLELKNAVGAALGMNARATLTIVDDQNDSTPTTGENNPYLNNEFFVRMNYLDFLGREPDAEGWNTWPVVLNNCGPEKGFLGAPKNCDRAHISHGFFASTEFIDTGFLIYRMYEVGMGRLPRYSEFTPDMATLSGFGLTDAVKQQNLQDYLQEFTSRAEFTNRFSDSLQPSQAALLMQKLEQAAGVTLPATATTKPGQPTQYSRQQLIDLRAAGTLTVGQTLKAFVEQQVVYDRYFTSGEVTMMYFAFLRRDPDLNDPNLVGWNDWVNVFTNGGQRADGTVIEPRDIHHLIFGFIYSEEYRKRFGQP